MRIPRMMLRHVGLAWGFLLALVMVFHADGVRADWLQDLEADAVTWMAEEGSPGMAIVIVKDDVAIYMEGFGHLINNSSSQPVNEDSLFIIGSTSKAFCSAQIAVLADRNLLNWNDPVRKHLPSFRINVRSLGKCAVSGRGPPVPPQRPLYVFPYDDGSFGLPDARGCGDPFSATLHQLPLRLCLSELHVYRGFETCGSHDGQSWGENLSDSIFKPLGMTRTSPPRPQ